MKHLRITREIIDDLDMCIISVDTLAEIRFSKWYLKTLSNELTNMTTQSGYKLRKFEIELIESYNVNTYYVKEK